MAELTKPWKSRYAKNAQVLINGQTSKCSVLCDEESNKGLKSPRGLALFQSAQVATLYVADFDSDLDASNIYAYNISAARVGSGGVVNIAEQRLVVKEVPGIVAALAVDSYGNLFFTSSKAKQVEMVNRTSLLAGGLANSTVLYGQDQNTVKAPAGVAADNFYVYWANKEGDAQTGTVVRAPESLASVDQMPPAALAAASDLYEPLASNVCLARDNLFFTGETKALFVTKTSGGTLKHVSRAFDAPRGCAYDMESTLYVADSSANMVKSLPANLGELRAIRHVSEVVTVSEPDQLAVFIH